MCAISTAPSRLVRQAVVFGEPDCRTTSSLSVRRARPFGGLAQRSPPARFFLAREFTLCSGTRLFAQRPLQIPFHEASLGAVHGRAAHANAPCDLLVAGPDIAPLSELLLVPTAAQHIKTIGFSVGVYRQPGGYRHA